MLSQGPVLEPPNTLSPFRSRPASLIGARRMFPAHFKLQVLDAYRYDNDCKGNQRATARKFNVHRRQIQKWLQCESALRSSVADALQYSAEASKLSNFNNKNSTSDQRLPEPSSRVFKHDARTLKLVAQKLYPSTMSGPISKDDQKGDVKTCFVPKEHQLNDIKYREMGVDNLGCKFNIRVDHSVPSLNLKDNVSFQLQSKLPIKNITPRPQEVRILPAPKPMNPTPPTAHRPIYSSLPSSSSSSSSSPYSEEPYNLVMNAPTSPPTAPRPPTPKAGLPVGAYTSSTSPLPARVAEIVADSKTSAFSPKRKWLNNCLQDKNNENNPPVCDEPKQKKPCLNFSIERLCGLTEQKSDENGLAPVSACYPTPLPFPPPLMLQNRSIPELASLHFKPEFSEPIIVKEEAISDDDDEPIDVTSTTPLEEKTFDFPDCSNNKRRSFSVQFKLNVLDAFYNDKDCNQNQRATARKFNINRRQVQKWLNLENSLRGEICHKCPQHCAINFQQCSEPSCLRDLSSGIYANSSQASAFPLPFIPWYFSYGVNGIY